jgi:hypothetical protein
MDSRACCHNTPLLCVCLQALLTDAEDIRQGADLDRISQEVQEAGLGDLEADWAEAEALKQGLTTTGGTGTNKAFSPAGGTQLVRPARAPGGLAAWQQQLPLQVQQRLAAQERKKVGNLPRSGVTWANNHLSHSMHCCLYSS